MEMRLAGIDYHSIGKALGVTATEAHSLVDQALAQRQLTSEREREKMLKQLDELLALSDPKRGRRRS
jgi:hypothetical protein